MDKLGICEIVFASLETCKNFWRCLIYWRNDMFEIARYLEQMAIRFDPVILVVPGLAAVLLGLFVWLGGLGFRRALFAILGAVSGGACGIFINAQSVFPAILLAAVAALLAVMLEKMFITILAAVLAAVICFAVLAGPYIEKDAAAASISRSETRDRVELSIQQSTKTVKECTTNFVIKVKQILFQMPAQNWAIMAAVAVVFMAAGVYQSRLTSAFCCAALGVTLIFTGMILLLLYKGAAPVSRILQNQLFYLGVFAVMTIFGMTEQLLLCPRVKKKPTAKKKKDDEVKRPEGVSNAWRNK